MATVEEKYRAKYARIEAETKLSREQEADDYLAVLRGGDEADKILARRALELEAGEYSPGDLRIDKGIIHTKDGRPVWPSEDTKTAATEKIGKVALANPGSVDYTTRFNRGIKMSPQAQREYTQAATGGAVVDTPEGQVAFPGGKPTMVDRPFEAGNVAQLISIAYPFLAPAAMIGAEILTPGTTEESVKDVLDWSGDAEEAAPEVAGELLMRRVGMGAGKRLIPQAVLAAAGTASRRAHSEMLPGQDISMEDTLKRAGVNAALSGASELVTTPIAEVFPTSAGPTAPERWVGKKLIQGGDPAAVRRGMALEAETGVQFTPGQLNMGRGALGFEDLLKESPGTMDLWDNNTMRQIQAASHHTNRRLGVLLGSSLPQKDLGQKVYSTARGYLDKLDTARKTKFAEILQGHEDVPFSTTNAQQFAKEAKELGVAIPMPSDVMTLRQYQQKLHLATQMAYGRGPLLAADRKASQHWGQQWKEALLKDLDSNIQDPMMRDAADALVAARESYRDMSKPIDEARVSMVNKVLGLGKNKRFEEIPQALLESKSTEPVQIVMSLLKDDPKAAMQLRRGVMDQAIGKSVLSGGTTPTAVKAGAVSRATGETLYSPAAIPTALRKHKELFVSMAGDDAARMAHDIDVIADTFDRIAATGKAGSRTTPMKLMDKILEIVASPVSAVTSPKQTLQEFVKLGYKSRLSSMLLDPVKRDMLVGLAKVPRNDLLRTAATTLEQLAAMEGADEYGLLPGDEEP